LEQMEFEKRITLIMDALSDAGYDPVAQITGYIQTGDDTFITRKNDAISIIRTLDKKQIEQYFEDIRE